MASERPRIDAGDLDLLRHFEPVLRFTKGETFFPMRVGDYLAHAAHLRRSAGVDVTIAAPGTLDERTLATDPDASGREFITVVGVEEPGRISDLLGRSSHQAVGFRRGGGRLARVGYASRLVDALFALGLLARGRVPGALARRAVEQYRTGDGTNAHAYYGRVVRGETWTALQYWFFYAYNDWRTGFNGANDHEADWEQIVVYVYGGPDGTAIPGWVAYAQHDYHGADLRRRWDHADELELVGDHPVVNVGAGSHASYFRAGEYLAEQELKMPPLLRTGINTFSRLLNGHANDADARILPVAFVDFARGDGLQIGPGCERGWSAVVLDESQPWAGAYRGLWGISVEDPFEGEDAPAGPMFNRDGTVRSSWSDPIGFAALHAVPPPTRERELLEMRAAAVRLRQEELARSIAELELQTAEIGAEGGPASGRASSRDDGVDALRTQLAEQYAERADGVLRLSTIQQRLERQAAGIVEAPDAHIRRMAVPDPPGNARFGRALELWAAVSIGLLLLALVAILVFDPAYGVVIALVVIGAFVLIESILQRGVIDLIVLVTRILALLAAAVVAVTFWQALVIGVAIAAGLFVIRENVSELASGA
ncbi:MAG: hypothetical protein IT341_02770 [Chloroflexi bacterium]|nr:hypothetical protein [Chloroflexota bacterium]